MDNKDFLTEIATDWDKYCDFFGGKNLESKQDFLNGDLEERLEYLMKEFGE